MSNAENEQKEERVLARITSTWIGLEDHGHVTINVEFAGEGFNQGTGHFPFDRHMPSLAVVGSTHVDEGSMAFFIRRFLEVTGSSQWERLTGAMVYVIRIDGVIRGIENVAIGRPKERFMFRNAFHPRTVKRVG